MCKSLGDQGSCPQSFKHVHLRFNQDVPNFLFILHISIGFLFKFSHIFFSKFQQSSFLPFSSHHIFGHEVVFPSMVSLYLFLKQIANIWGDGSTSPEVLSFLCLFEKDAVCVLEVVVSMMG